MELAERIITGLETYKAFWVKYKELLILNSVLLVFMIILMWIKPIDSLRKYEIYNHPDGKEETMIPIYGDMAVSQLFTCTGTADSLEVYVESVNEEYTGSFRVRLLDENEDIIGEWLTEKLDIDEGFIQYRLKNAVMMQGSNYRLEVSAPDLDEFGAIGVTAFDLTDSVSGVNDLSYKGEGPEYSVFDGKTMSFGVYMHRLNIFAIGAFLCLFASVNLCFVMRNKGTEWISVPVLVAAGLIMMLILAPGCGPDDIYHYYSSVTLSNKILGRSNINEIERVYESDLPIHHNTNKALVETYEGLRYRVNGEEGTFIYEGGKDKLKWPVSHLAQAAGITLGRLLRLGFIRVYTLGRIFNMAAYIALAVLAVRLVPVNKELMLMMAILPMSMQQVTQLSYDMPVNGIALVFVAYVFKILYESNPFSWKNTVICTLLLVAISPLKVVYILLGLLVLLIPQSQFGSIADRVIKIGIQAGCSAASLIVARGGDVSGNMVRPAQEAALTAGIRTIRNYTVRFVLDEPVRYIRLILMNGESHLSNMFKGMIGGSLAGFSLNIPEQLVMFFALCLLICALSDKEAIIKSRRQMLITLAIPVIGYFAVLTVFLFAETVYGTGYIGGTQGRYLIPFFFPTMYCLCGRKLSIQINRLALFVPIAFIELGYIVEVMSNIDF